MLGTGAKIQGKTKAKVPQQNQTTYCPLYHLLELFLSPVFPVTPILVGIFLRHRILHVLSFPPGPLAFCPSGAACSASGAAPRPAGAAGGAGPGGASGRAAEPLDAGKKALAPPGFKLWCRLAHVVGFSSTFETRTKESRTCAARATTRGAAPEESSRLPPQGRGVHMFINVPLEAPSLDHAATFMSSG